VVPGERSVEVEWKYTFTSPFSSIILFK